MKIVFITLLIIIVFFLVIGVLQKIGILPQLCYQFYDAVVCYSILDIDFWKFYNTDWNRFWSNHYNT